MCTYRLTLIALVPWASLTVAACDGSGSSASFVDYRIVASGGGALTAAVGDGFHLSVVEGLSDGTTRPLASDAQVTWSGPPLVTALPVGSTPDASILPPPAAAATAMWIENPDHLTPAQVAGVLFVLDAGSNLNPSIEVMASVAGGTVPAAATTATATVSVTPFPTGDVSRGQALYAANCAACHGAQGEGASAPGLNADPDNVADDPTWTPQLLGIAARTNMDNAGVSLDPSMPKWLLRDGASGQLLSTQDFSDIYVFLKTQHSAGAATSP